MTDNRCPKCNQPVSGRTDILSAKPVKLVKECQHCKAPIVLRFNEDGKLSAFYYAVAGVNTLTLANRFSVLLLRDIGSKNLKTVVKLNRTAKPSVCHSHDFCDANMTMLEAYSDVMKISQDAVDLEAACPEMDAAWSLAKQNEFVEVA